MKMADMEKQMESQGTSSKAATSMPTAWKWTRIRRLCILRVVGVLLLFLILKNFIRDTVLSNSRACSMFDWPRFPFPRRHMSMKQREELFL
jgi:hypothetical protein